MALIFLALAYLLGSIPFGLLIGKWVKNIDVRGQGSGNIGATNVARVIGKKWGIFVFCLDVFKGFFAVSLSKWFGFSDALVFLLLLSLFAIAGHTFPVWLKFKGGKGVATALGVFLAVSWMPTLFSFGIWNICFWSTRIISIASILAAFSFPFSIYFFDRQKQGVGYFLLIAVLLCAFILYTHRENIRRLLQGTEKKLF